MKSFFKTLLASTLGLFIAIILFSVVVLIIISAIVSSQDKAVEVKENSVFKLALNKPIVERVNKDPFSNIDPFSLNSEKEFGLNDILENIKKAAEQTNIKGILLNVSYVQASYGTTSEIRKALEKFKESGKFVIAYSDFYSQKAYYLATIADKVYLNPQGVVELKGLRAELMYFKNALKKLGIEAQVVKHGKFKNAAEVFVRDNMSYENRIQLNGYIKSVWNYVSNEIAYSRHLTQKEVLAYADNIEQNSIAEDALKLKLVDDLKYIDELYEELKDTLQVNKLSFIQHSQLNHVPAKRKGKGLAKDKVAVIYAYGNVVMGNDGEGSISSERISTAIRKARKDSSVKAIVFRINSGGGSALASEVIWREIVLAREVKPVIASFGDIAASGGYYIACPANVIMANEATLTGSIGVWGMIPNAKKLMNEKLGINIEIAKTNSHADYPNVFKPLNEVQKRTILRALDNVYETFVQHVSEGRDMTYDDVDEIAQGRIWSGAHALNVKLIDKYGGLTDAIDEAAKIAELDYYRVVDLPKLDDPLEAIMKKLNEDVHAAISLKDIEKSKKLLEKEIKKYTGVQAMLPYMLEID